MLRTHLPTNLVMLIQALVWAKSTQRELMNISCSVYC